MTGKRRMGSRNERPHAYHLRFQFFQKSNVVQQAIPCLTGRPHHHAGSSLIPQNFQRPQAFPTPGTVHLTWMQTGIMRLIPCFVAKQVTIHPCITPPAVHLPVAFPHRQRDGMSGELRAELAHQFFNPILILFPVFSALQDKSPEAEPCPLPATIEYLLLRQTVARGETVGTTKPAIIAVVAAPRRDFNESANEYPVPETLPGRLCRKGTKRLILPVVQTGK